MTEAYLLLLNADFVVSGGSLHHVGELMQQGKRVIRAPSFRVVAEYVKLRKTAVRTFAPSHVERDDAVL